MDTPTVASSTLTRQRIGLVALFVASAVTAGYYAYHNTPPAAPATQLRRSNAVRHRRRSLPNVVHAHDGHAHHGHAHDHAHDGHDSDASWTSQEDADAPADENENADHAAPRPVVMTTTETVADGDVMEEEWFNEPANFGNPRAGQNIVNLLFRVSEDNSRRNAYVHRGCQCNACGIAPIRGIRYRCANCADFDLCETCESQGLHNKTHIFYKIKLPAPRLGPRQLQPVWYPGSPEDYPRNLPRALIAKLSRETGFERPELDALWEQWTFMACTEWRDDPDELGLAMDRRTFERYLVPSSGYKHTAPNLLHDRIFAFYDTNNDDLIGFSEYVHGTAFRKTKDRLRKIFDGYDVDRDGYVNRRDFLHLFRAYYVLFKQMHRDVVEGLDDQAMSSADTHGLVASRQPLSGMFGREGFPSGDPDRPVEGKMMYSNNGEVIVSDGGNLAIKDDKTDTADRQEMLTSLFSRPSRMIETIFTTAQGPDPRYLSGILDPPTRIDELPPLLAGENRSLFMVVGPSPDQEASSEGPGEESGGDGARSRQEEQDPSPAGESGAEILPGTRAGHRQVDFAQQEEPVSRTDDDIWQHTDRRPRRIVAGRRTRFNSRRKLLDRWKRRHFYLDEEEGGVPPAGWTDEEDVLASGGDKAKSSKHAQKRAFFPSRSSSSERWDGLGIPDAERDAGKEIFYQVSQQAFNEILDIFFKVKEDLAIEAAETKEMRERFRPLFESIDLQQEDRLQPDGSSDTLPSFGVRADKVEKPVSEQSLNELLQWSGYFIDPDAAQTATPNVDTDTARQQVPGDNMAADDEDSVQPAAEETRPGAESSGEETGYRDPTMPQFRPDSASTSPRAEPSARKTSKLPAESLSPAGEETDQIQAGSSQPRSATPANGTCVREGKRKKAKVGSVQAPVPRAVLVRWKQLDAEEEEAKARGGWGRLSYAEFEEIYKLEEQSGSRLDYLGTWIDFCIPCH